MIRSPTAISPNVSRLALVALMATSACVSGKESSTGDSARLAQGSTLDSARAMSDSSRMAADSTLGDETGEEITPSDTGAGAYDPRSAAAIGFWRLVGTEPFWGVRIDTSGIVFSSPEVPDGIRLGLSVPVLDSDTLRFNSTTERVPAHDIEVKLVEKTCSDGMSDKSWSYAARVIFDKKEYQGCGERLTSAPAAPASRP